MCNIHKLYAGEFVFYLFIYLFRFILDLDLKLEHFDPLTHQIWAPTYVLPEASHLLANWPGQFNYIYLICYNKSIFDVYILTYVYFNIFMIYL